MWGWIARLLHPFSGMRRDHRRDAVVRERRVRESLEEVAEVQASIEALRNEVKAQSRGRWQHG